jgi:hypothetical protein
LVLRWPLLVLFVVLASGSRAGPSSGLPVPATFPFTQGTFNASTNEIGITYSGSNASTSGMDFDKTGTAYYSVSTLPTGTGISYVSKQFGSGSAATTYQRQVIGGVETSTYYWPYTDPNTNTQQYVRVVPGAALEGTTLDQLGGTNSDPVGIDIKGQHNDTQLTGGISNDAPNRTAAIEGLVQSVKDSAAFTLNMQTYSGNISYGTSEKPVLVYASGTKNANGTITEGTLHFSGQMTGYGILVVQIDNPDNGNFDMSGQSQWTGLVIVVANKNGTGKKQVLDFVGGGGGGLNQHIVGGALLYMKGGGAGMLMRDLVKLAGVANIEYSSLGVAEAFRAQPSSMQVRSWRKLSENE